MRRPIIGSNKEFDFIIIGAGMVGVALLYELSRRGASVLILEASSAAAGASGGNLGLILPEPLTSEPDVTLMVQGLRRIANLEQELDYDLQYEECGILYLAHNGEEMAEGEQIAKDFRALGYPFEMVSGNQLPGLEPYLNSDGLAGAVYFAEQARLNPFRLVYAYLKKAREQGALARFGEPVLGFMQEGGIVNGVVTSQGEYRSNAIIITAGAWTRELALKLGVALPQFYIHGEAMVTEPITTYLKNVVSLVHCDRIDMEKEAAKNALAGKWKDDWCSNRAIEFAVSQTADGEIVVGEISYATPNIGQQTSHDSISLMAKNVINYFPDLASTHVIRSWVSPIPFTPDHLPFVGRLPGVSGVTVCSGFSSAIVVTPIVTDIFADWLLGKNVSTDLSPYDPVRFSKDATKTEGDSIEL